MRAVGALGALERLSLPGDFSRSRSRCAACSVRLAVDSSVTIVLPLHNAERTLRPMVARILELGAAPARRLTLALVDDGSTDETFETACELSRDFPQVRVFRQPFQRGLGPALEQVRRGLGVSEAIVHDGVGPIDFDELSAMLRETSHTTGPAPEATGAEGRGSRRFAAVSALNAHMLEAHRKLASFHWLKLPEADRSRRRMAAPMGDMPRGMTPLTSLPNMTLGDVPVPLY